MFPPYNYTNITHGESINACTIALRSNNQTKPSVRHLTDLIRHVLTKNNFTFLDKNFIQIQGPAMGTIKMAPSYANLFMSDLEDRLLSSAPHRPLVWWRFIDNIFCPQGISTDVYCKPTDTHQYLLSDSCHPKHCKEAIAYSQALCIRRICSIYLIQETAV